MLPWIGVLITKAPLHACSRASPRCTTAKIEKSKSIKSSGNKNLFFPFPPEVRGIKETPVRVPLPQAKNCFLQETDSRQNIKAQLYNINFTLTCTAFQSSSFTKCSRTTLQQLNRSIQQETHYNRGAMTEGPAQQKGIIKEEKKIAHPYQKIWKQWKAPPRRDL